MRSWFRAVIATGLIVTVAVGLASARIYSGAETTVGVKADRLEVVAVPAVGYFTVETRSEGVSVLSRVPLGNRD